jgi:hypothetical protein
VAGRGVRTLLAALTVLALIVSGCTRPSAGSINAQPADLYAAIPPISDVRVLLGGDTWWPGPPAFGVRPLDVSSMAFTEKFSVSQPYVHVGTAETFLIDFTLWDSASTATTHMKNIATALGTSVSGPKVGDQALYYGSQGSSAAPYQTATFVRIGQITTSIGLSLKDAFPKVAQLGKIATKVVARLKDVISGRLRGTPVTTSDSAVLPPTNLDITSLATTRIPVESAIVMIDATSLDALAQSMRGRGVSDVVFGDYALNSDTHMEVRALVFAFLTAKDATDWTASLRGTTPPDQPGFFDPGHGWYMFPFAAGSNGAMLICRSTSDVEAASRACEEPLSRVTSAWKLSLGA